MLLLSAAVRVLRQLLAARLRRSNIDASAGAVDGIARIVELIRARWPSVRFVPCADSGFPREALRARCEQIRVDFVFGLGRNARLVDEIFIELAWAGEETSTAEKSVQGLIAIDPRPLVRSFHFA